MTNLPHAPGQPLETAANTGYSGEAPWPRRESPGGMGWGRGPSGSRRGDGPPSRRRVAGLRDRDAATPRAGRRPSGCKPLSAGKTSTVPAEEAPAKYVPAAAVIRMGRALSGFIGRKARVGGSPSGTSNPGAQPRAGSRTGGLEFGRGRRNSRCSGEMRRYREEHRWRRQPPGPSTDAEVRKPGERTGLDTLVVPAVNDGR